MSTLSTHFGRNSKSEMMNPDSRSKDQNYTTYKNMKPAALDYSIQGYVPIGVTLSWDVDRQQISLPAGWQNATLDTSKQYFSRENNGIAILTGERSDLIVVDCDVLEEKAQPQGMLDGTEIFQAMVDAYGHVDCPIAKSANGGMQYFFSLSKSLAKGLKHADNASRIVISKGLNDAKTNNTSITVETHSDGGYIIVSPTSFEVNSEIQNYEWVKPLVHSSNLKSMPVWCIRLINESRASCAQGEFAVSSGVTKSSKHSTTITISDHALFLKQTQLYIEELYRSTMVTIWSRSNGYDFSLPSQTRCVCCPSTHVGSNYMVKSVIGDCFLMRNYAPECYSQVFNWENHPVLRMVIETPRADAPYSRMLREAYHNIGHCLVFSPKGRFLNFNGTVWEEMDKHVVTREIDSICGNLMDQIVNNLTVGMQDGYQAPDWASEELQQKINKFRVGRDFLRSHANLNGIATHYKQIYIDMEVESHLDKNPNLLAVKNGIIDLRTGILREGMLKDYMQTQLDTDYNPLGKTDIIDGFVDSIFSSDIPTIHYVQKLFGYGITGHTKEQIWAILTGDGSNGKSLFIGIIESLLRKWCVNASYDVFFKGDKRTTAGGATPHLAALKGARICVKEETEPKDKLNVEILKMITGESSIAARALYKDEESFRPTVLPILLCNHKPTIDIEDDAMMRRIIVVPFHNIYTSPTDINRPYDKENPRHKTKDTSLKEKLHTAFAQEQLLAWLVQGSVKWFKEGLGEQPQSMKDALLSYKEENDRLKLFIDAMCELPPIEMSKKDILKSGYHVNAKEFKDRLVARCGVNYSQKELIEKMATKGLKYDKPWNFTERVYVGLKFTGL